MPKHKNETRTNDIAHTNATVTERVKYKMQKPLQCQQESEKRRSNSAAEVCIYRNGPESVHGNRCPLYIDIKVQISIPDTPRSYSLSSLDRLWSLRTDTQRVSSPASCLPRAFCPASGASLAYTPAYSFQRYTWASLAQASLTNAEQLTMVNPMPTSGNFKA